MQPAASGRGNRLCQNWLRLIIACARDRRPAPQPPELPAPPVATRVDVSLVEGTLVQDDKTILRVGAEVPADRELHAPGRAKLAMYSWSIVVAADSDVRRASIDHALLLDSGRVDVDGEGMRIVTPRFAVDVTGTATVSPRRVSVQHGSARIVGLDGKPLTRLEAGGSWMLPVSHPVADAFSASKLIERARTAFTAGQYASAKRDAEAALNASPSRTQTAEARTILAECAQATGALDDALNRYQDIATRFADLPAGETALFAAARLEAGRGHAAAARTLSEQYLARYSSGRFADDARRLRALP